MLEKRAYEVITYKGETLSELDEDSYCILYVILYYIILYYIILYHIILYYIISYYIILYYIKQTQASDNWSCF